ncbi:hypothetical protein [Bacillus cereus group sp. BfR-BA-01380]|uniref:hypothetical protein n=1 Tax=Bacillus cereus group sp. BfR-BA-01380 TaxID=2920324 RepID=UPI001F59550A|nr:hypothetical protein [Bacillus cereus group sp. BfR-BA-01380]
MNAQQLQEKIDKLYYWDARVLKLYSDNFSDVVILAYDDGEEIVTYRFLCCYKSEFLHWLDYEKEKPYRTLKQEQIPYFLQDIKVEEIEKEKRELYLCKILMPPMEVEIWCKDIEISSDVK